jgi:hypothetical protein
MFNNMAKMHTGKIVKMYRSKNLNRVKETKNCNKQTIRTNKTCLFAGVLKISKKLELNLRNIKPDKTVIKTQNSCDDTNPAVFWIESATVIVPNPIFVNVFSKYGIVPFNSILIKTMIVKLKRTKILAVSFEFLCFLLNSRGNMNSPMYMKDPTILG